MEEIQKLDGKQFKAKSINEFDQFMGGIYQTKDLQIEELSQKINEIIEFINKLKK